MRDRRERLAEEADIQCALRGFNEAVQRGIECGVVAIVCSTVIRGCTGDLTSSDDGFGQVVIYMSVDASQRELDTRDRALVAAIEQNSPAIGRCLAGERGFEGRKVETRELYVELGKPLRIGESTGSHPRFRSLRHLQVQPVEPFQAIPVYTSGVDGPENLENIRDGLRGGLNSSEERRVIGKHGPW